MVLQIKETINFISKSKHGNSNTQKHKEKIGIVVIEYVNIQPENEEIVYLFDKVIKD